MRILFIFLMLATSPLYGQKALSRESFMINVRPVMSGIVGDFYQMITLFPELPKELIPIIEALNDLSDDKENLRVSCPSLLNAKCKSQVKTIRFKLVQLKSLSQTLLHQQKMSKELHLNTLSGLRLVTQFDSELEDIKGYLDNASLIMAAGLKQKRETSFVIKKLDELNTYLSLAVIEYIPFLYREEFKHFYFNFIHPIQQQITKNSNYEFVNKNITSLNFAINLFNMGLTKKNKKTPEGMAPFLATLHNRWNSILRFYF